ncbi:MAG TPA: glycosyltransferase, partial [Kiloniellales bacterium]|nr:glycosyltransferase [Kiloniellales bacterium]
HTHYFQSGVMCLDLARFREGIDEEVLEIVMRYPTLSYPDQDALNIVLAQSRRFIDPRWNHSAPMGWYYDSDSSPYDSATFASLREDPFVVHYTGKPKPWEDGCTHPFAGEWFAAHQQTAWAARRQTWFNLAVDRIPRARRMIIKKVRRALNL